MFALYQQERGASENQTWLFALFCAVCRGNGERPCIAESTEYRIPYSAYPNKAQMNLTHYIER
jgi:hypothetical protein